MFHSIFSLARKACAVSVLSAALGLSAPAICAENNDTAPPDKAAPAGQEPAKENQKVDEYAEAQKALSGPAGNPECVWLGRRVVSLLWRDDLDTAFRHLDLYDRFGCPSAHIQATFPLPHPARKQHRSEGRRHAEWPRFVLLGQSN